MKKIILSCICLAMSMANATAQSTCTCSQCGCQTNVFYLLTVNGNECRFDGKNAHIAASHLLHAKEKYFLNVDNPTNQSVHVYKLKKKGEYAIVVGGNCFYYHNNTTILRPLRDLNVKYELYTMDDSKESYVMGYNTLDHRSVLAIYRD